MSHYCDGAEKSVIQRALSVVYGLYYRAGCGWSASIELILGTKAWDRSQSTTAHFPHVYPAPASHLIQYITMYASSLWATLNTHICYTTILSHASIDVRVLHSLTTGELLVNQQLHYMCVHLYHSRLSTGHKHLSKVLVVLGGVPTSWLFN